MEKAHNSSRISEADRLPVVAIVGRPNVGKSALFNRIAGKRISVVHAQSGVTRDRIMIEASWRDRAFILIDTGGISAIDGSASSDLIERSIHTQVDAALNDADCAIMLVDIKAGIVPLDIEVARALRKRGLTAVLAANKADRQADDDTSSIFEELGLPVVPVSAIHSRNIKELMNRVLSMIPHAQIPPETNRLKVTVAGRPNVGKSSFINAILNNDRMIVSDIAGTTHDSVDIPFTSGEGETARHYLLIDTPGIRRTNKIPSAVDKFGVIRAQESIRRADICVLMLDSVQGPTAFDKKIADTIVQHDKGCLIVVNKWDLAEGIKEKEYSEALRRAMPFMRHCPIVFVSSVTQLNLKKSIEMMEHISGQVSLQIPTSTLNRALEDAERKVAPPTVKGKKLHMYYAVQTNVKPLRFSIFVNNPKLIVESYRDYLINSLRAKFGLEGAPVILTFRNRPRRQL